MVERSDTRRRHRAAPTRRGGALDLAVARVSMLLTAPRCSTRDEISQGASDDASVVDTLMRMPGKQTPRQG